MQNAGLGGRSPAYSGRTGSIDYESRCTRSFQHPVACPSPPGLKVSKSCRSAETKSCLEKSLGDKSGVYKFTESNTEGTLRNRIRRWQALQAFQRHTASAIQRHCKSRVRLGSNAADKAPKDLQCISPAEVVSCGSTLSDCLAIAPNQRSVSDRSGGPSMVGSRPPRSVHTWESHSPISSVGPELTQ